ncbi:MAG: DUF445 family protein [Lentihominibacter sp.]|nr:DUF445 family protein [Clostridiales bacterium]MDY2680458.1 DUF445 family protein [Lentihominibacter sp.]
MEVLHYIAGPLLGAVIGYCTNWIAVKMLFKPLEPIKVFGRTLPFTPGVIPKNRGRIAAACGKAVGETLLTEDDLKAAFIGQQTKEKVTDALYEKMTAEEFTEMTVEGIGIEVIGEEKLDDVKGTVSAYLIERISKVLSEFDYCSVITDVGGRFVREKLNNPMISMMLNDNVIASFAAPAADSIREYIAGEGREKISEISTKEIDNICGMNIGNTISSPDNKELIKTVIGEIYEKAVTKVIPLILHEINIGRIVEEKICSMDMKFVEELILSIMKNELDYVVRLGALIGLVIGTVNIFI